MLFVVEASRRYDGIADNGQTKLVNSPTLAADGHEKVCTVGINPRWRGVQKPTPTFDLGGIKHRKKIRDGSESRPYQSVTMMPYGFAGLALAAALPADFLSALAASFFSTLLAVIV